MSVATVREAIANALRTIDGLHADPYIVETVRPPHAMVDFSVEYDLTFARGADAYEFVVMVYAQRSAAQQSQVFLDTLRSGGSGGIKATLEGDTELAAEVDYIRVVRVNPPGVVTVGNADFLLVTFECEVVF